MVSRLREKPNGFQGSGSARRLFYGSTAWEVANQSFSDGLSRCVDVVDGTRNDHPLSIEHLNRGSSYERLSGNDGDPKVGWYYSFDDYVPAYYRNTGAPAHLSVSLPDSSTAATALLARSNPSRPTVSLPVAIAELKDVPGMLRDIGNDLLKSRKVIKNYHQQVGSHYLAGLFGWAPLISDVIKLTQFQGSVERRANEFKRLYSNGGLKRRLTLAEAENKEESQLYVESQIALISCLRVKRTKGTVWGTVRWLPTSLPPGGSRSDAVYRRMAQGVVLGLGARLDATDWRNSKARNDAWSDVADLWQLMPWSWMVDWFSNVGDYLNAHRNTVPAESSRVNIMTRIHTTDTYKRLPGNDWAQGGGAVLDRESLSRTQHSGPVLTANLGFLSRGQVSILGALAVQRLPRR